MKIYISIPMTGCLEWAIEKEKEVKKQLKEQYPEAEIISGFDVNPVWEGLTYAYMMGRDIEALLECDTFVLVGEWEKSKGCTLENAAATTYGLKYLPHID